MKEELGIYVHIPFCKQKCYYCDFVSFAGSEEWEEQYIEALKKEICANKEKAKEYRVNTVYIGGGTPSYIDSKQIISILDIIRKNYEMEEETEITIEVNPGTVTREKLEDYKKAGINRLSIGLQSADNTILKQIGRIHTYEEFLETYDLARKIGFTNINVDLMLALPNQTEEILQDSLKKVIKLNPEHISLYSLILEENTKMASLVEEGKQTLPEEETERNMYWNTKKVLEENGYIHYEISNFSKPEKRFQTQPKLLEPKTIPRLWPCCSFLLPKNQIFQHNRPTTIPCKGGFHIRQTFPNYPRNPKHTRRTKRIYAIRIKKNRRNIHIGFQK